MRKFFRKAMKPDKPFEIWAEENNIELTKKEQPNQTFFKKPVFIWSCVAVILIIMSAIIIPLVMPDDSEKYYTTQDTVSINITLEELYEVNGLLLFDVSQIINSGRVSIDYPIENENLILSYGITSHAVATTDGNNAFYVTYTVRLYHNYNFYSYEEYSNLTFSFSVGNTNVHYKIVEEESVIVALLSFTYNNLEYFLRAEGFEGVTEISEDTLKILLGDLLPKT